MKKITTLSAILAANAIVAQPPTGEYHMTFDTGSDITIDSIYGAPGWQTGAPVKTVFDSAFSAPNALVTDTLLPYLAGGTSYAEFHIPVNFYGELVMLEFIHRMDVDSGEAYGWLEYFDAFISQDWKIVKRYDVLPGGDIMYPAGDLGFGGTGGWETDSGLVFSHHSPLWDTAQIGFMCYGVFQPNEQYRGGGPDSMRFRFAFLGNTNTSGRDGWLVDNVYLSSWGCPGAIHESWVGSLEIFPNPSDHELVITGDGLDGQRVELQVIRGDGAFIPSKLRRGKGRIELDVSALPQGLYLLKLSSGDQLVTHRVVVQR